MAQSKQQRLEAIDKKIAALSEQRAKVEAEIEVSAVTVGQTINYLFGRGENRKTYVGVVIAEQGGRIKVQTGEGFDTELRTIGTGDIVVTSADTGNAASAVGGAQAQGATAGAGATGEPTAAEQANAAAVAEAAANTQTQPAANTEAVAQASAAALAALGL